MNFKAVATDSLLLWLLILLSVPSANAAQIQVGLQIGQKAVWIEEINGDGTEVARVEGDFTFAPTLTLSSEGKYFSDSSQWGYFYTVDSSIFNIHTQTLSDEGDPVDLGTHLNGYAIYAVPVLFYHFNRFNNSHWQHKVGIGVGLGLLSLSGNFRITKPGHPDYGITKSVNASGLDIAAAVYYVAEKYPHSILVQNYGPVLDKEPYRYQQHNVVMAYRYSFEW